MSTSSDSITVEINGKRKTYTAPSSWNNLTTAQLLHAYQIVHRAFSDSDKSAQELPQKKLALLAPLFGLSISELFRFRQDLITEDPEHGATTYLEVVQKLIYYTDPLFLFIENENVQRHGRASQSGLASQSGSPLPEALEGRRVTINPTLTRTPWPQLKHRDSNRKYFGPRDRFENFTLSELGTVMTLYKQYTESIKKQGGQSQQILNTLIATIYRPPKPPTKENKEKAYEGDIRLPLAGYEATVEKRAKDIATLPTMVKKVILFYIQSCIHSITQEWQHLFKKIENSDQGQAAERSPKGDFGTLIIKLAGGLVHLDQVANQPYENAFIYLNMIEEERQEAELKQALAKRRRR